MDSSACVYGLVSPCDHRFSRCDVLEAGQPQQYYVDASARFFSQSEDVLTVSVLPSVSEVRVRLVGRLVVEVVSCG